MSSAFVKEEEYQKLSDVSLSIRALLFYRRQENNGQVISVMKSFFSGKCGSHVYEMSDGLTHALGNDGKRIINLEAC